MEYTAIAAKMKESNVNSPQKHSANPDHEITNKTKISARLNKALKTATSVNRSSDLVTLNRDYDTMRRELKALISSARKYHDSMIQVDKARLDVSAWLSKLRAKSF